jgi:hypothetical protein
MWLTWGIMSTVSSARKRVTTRERIARVPLWKQAEDYFQRFRDPGMKITLPRLNLPEYEEDAA